MIYLVLILSAVFAQKPPRVDYCEMIEQEVQGRKHGFMHGNLAYYIGGHSNCWTIDQNETIGLTHPFFHDLRSRGTSIAEYKDVGSGNDYHGWEFYKDTRVAFGTVILSDGSRHAYPAPTSMKFRPDMMKVNYTVKDVEIYEEKFIDESISP